MDDTLRGIALISALIGIVVALWLERRRSKRGFPFERPYTWGFFQGSSAIAFGACCLLGSLFVAPSVIPYGLAAVIIYALPGFYVVQRKRWAWVVLTVLSLNPIIWIANYIYGRNRWNEFGPPRTLPTT